MKHFFLTFCIFLFSINSFCQKEEAAESSYLGFQYNCPGFVMGFPTKKLSIFDFSSYTYEKCNSYGLMYELEFKKGLGIRLNASLQHNQFSLNSRNDLAIYGADYPENLWSHSNTSIDCYAFGLKALGFYKINLIGPLNFQILAGINAKAAIQSKSETTSFDVEGDITESKDQYSHEFTPLLGTTLGTGFGYKIGDFMELSLNTEISFSPSLLYSTSTFKGDNTERNPWFLSFRFPISCTFKL